MKVIDVSASDGLRWLKLAWRDHFMKAPLSWVGLLAAWIMLGFSLLILLGFFGLFFFGLLQPVFFAGFMIACREQSLGNSPKVLHLFAGFKKNFSPLLSVGSLTIILHLLLSMLLDALGMPKLQLTADGKQLDMAAFQTGMEGNEWLLLVWVLITGLIQGALWFVPPLLAFHDMKASHAIRWSFFAFLSNFSALFLYGIAIMVIYILAILPAGAGLFIALPLMAISNYVGYKAMFSEDEMLASPRTGELH